MVGIISMGVTSAVPLASLADSGSTDPRTLDSWAPRSQLRKLEGSGSGSPSAFVISTSVACFSSTCSVFCRFSSRSRSPGSGDLDLFAGAESSAGTGFGGRAGEGDAATDAGGFGEASVAVADVEDAATPLVGAGVAEVGCSAGTTLSGGETGSGLTCVVGGAEGVVAASGAWEEDGLEGRVSRLWGGGSSVLTGAVGEVVDSTLSGLGVSGCCARSEATHRNGLRRWPGERASLCARRLTAPRCCCYRRLRRRTLCIVRHLLGMIRFIQRASAGSQPSRGPSGGLRSKRVEQAGVLMLGDGVAWQKMIAPGKY